jgi:hypothetical protein
MSERKCFTPVGDNPFAYKNGNAQARLQLLKCRRLPAVLHR